MSEFFGSFQPDVTLSSPWHIHMGRMFGFLIKDRGLKLPYPNQIKQDATISVLNPNKAQALANLLILHMANFDGNITIEDNQGKKYSPKPIGNQDELYKNLVAALERNPRIESIFKVTNEVPKEYNHFCGGVVVVCKKELIVHYADDFSDPYLNQFVSAAEALSGAMNTAYGNDAKLYATIVNERDFG